MSKLDNYIEQITVVVILYKEEFQTVVSCLNNIKNFKIIIIDNANDKNLKQKLIPHYNFYKYILKTHHIY